MLARWGFCISVTQFLNDVIPVYLDSHDFPVYRWDEISLIIDPPRWLRLLSLIICTSNENYRKAIAYEYLG